MIDLPNRLDRTRSEATERLGRKLAEHVVAVARSRIDTLAPAGCADPAIASERRDAQEARDGEVARILRNRWISERPFEGTSSKTLRRKLLAGALNPRARISAVLELSRRGENLTAE